MQLPNYIFLDQYIILTVISLLVAGLLLKNIIFKTKHIILKIALFSCLFSLPVYKVLIYNQFHFELYTKSFSIAVLNLLICTVYFVSLIYFIVLVINERYLRAIAIGCLVSIVLATLPLLFVAPIGPRNFYFIYVLWMILVLCFAKQYGESINSATVFIKTLVCILSFILIVGFSLIYNNSVHRIENIETQLKNGKSHKNIILERLPFERYTHLTTPTQERDLNDLKAYYDLPKDLKFKVVPFGVDGE